MKRTTINISWLIEFLFVLKSKLNTSTLQMAENLMIVLYVSQLRSELHGPEYLLRNEGLLI